MLEDINDLFIAQNLKLWEAFGLADLILLSWDDYQDFTPPKIKIMNRGKAAYGLAIELTFTPSGARHFFEWASENLAVEGSEIALWYQNPVVRIMHWSSFSDAIAGIIINEAQRPNAKWSFQAEDRIYAPRRANKSARASCRAHDGSFVPVPACKGRVQSVMLFFHEMKLKDPKFTLQDAWNIAKGEKPKTKLSKKTMKAAEKIAPDARQLLLPLSNPQKAGKTIVQKYVKLIKKAREAQKRGGKITGASAIASKKAWKAVEIYVENVAETIVDYYLPPNSDLTSVDVYSDGGLIQFEFGDQNDAKAFEVTLAQIFGYDAISTYDMNDPFRGRAFYIRLYLGLNTARSMGIQVNPQKAGKALIRGLVKVYKKRDHTALNEYLEDLAEMLLEYKLPDDASDIGFVVMVRDPLINFYFTDYMWAATFESELRRDFGGSGLLISPDEDTEGWYIVRFQLGETAESMGFTL